MAEFLNIVSEDDKIIAPETRKKIHEEGLLHQEVHVYFITPEKEIIFQHRAKDKDTFPDLLDATVGGHVEIGQTYEETAIKETEEETGIKIDQPDLIFIDKIKNYLKDESTNKINYAFQSKYLYVYRGDIADLKIEEGSALGFEVWPIDKLLNLDEEGKNKFIPYILKLATTELVKIINNLKI
ncbi:MAG: NUDIX hydrolase [Patescibacteria group bacterium]